MKKSIVVLFAFLMVLSLTPAAHATDAIGPDLTGVIEKADLTVATDLSASVTLRFNFAVTDVKVSFVSGGSTIHNGFACPFVGDLGDAARTLASVAAHTTVTITHNSACSGDTKGVGVYYFSVRGTHSGDTYGPLVIANVCAITDLRGLTCTVP